MENTYSKRMRSRYPKATSNLSIIDVPTGLTPLVSSFLDYAERNEININSITKSEEGLNIEVHNEMTPELKDEIGKYVTYSKSMCQYCGNSLALPRPSGFICDGCHYGFQ